jgi:hypothetical protein
MKKKTSYTDEDLGDIKTIVDFLAYVDGQTKNLPR